MRSIVFILFTSACLRFKPTESIADAPKSGYIEQNNPVAVLVLHWGSFRKELVYKGNLVAMRKTNLQLRVVNN